MQAGIDGAQRTLAHRNKEMGTQRDSSVMYFNNNVLLYVRAS